MTTTTSTVVVCSSLQAIRRRILHCPTCHRRTRFTQAFHGWYDDHLTCVACGDSWEAGYRMPRPFERGWRARAIADARHEWQTADTPRQFQAAVRAFIEDLRTQP